MKATKAFILTMLLNACFAATSMLAQAPNLLNYQGRVIIGGVAVSGNFSMTFSIYSAASGVTAAWTETQNVIVTNGLFNVLLGSANPFPSALFNGAGELYLGIRVGNDPEIVPRFRFTSVVFAIRASEADGVANGAVTTADLADATVTSAKIADGAVTNPKLTTNSVTSRAIQDGAVTDVDISPSASISGTKINSNFGSQNIVTTGSVGIGTSTPDSKFHVLANDGLVGLFESTIIAGLLTIKTSEGSENAVNIINRPGGHLALATGLSDRVVITKEGNVGIGNASPSERLQVTGNVAAFNFITPSSRSFKENITDLSASEAVETLQNLTPVKFIYKVDSEKDQHVGFIAEDVPDLVANPDRNGLNAMDIVAVLTKVVQVQQKEIAALREEMKSLQQQIRTKK